MTRFIGTPIRGLAFANAGDEAFSVRINSDTVARVRIDAGGRLTWSDGSTSGDTVLYRDSANVLKTDDAFQAVSGVITLTTDGEPVAALADGAIAIDTTNDVFYFRSNSTWQQVSGGGASVTVSATPPVGAGEGDLWFESDTGDVYVYYDSNWVDVGGTSVANIAMSDTAPADPVNGDFWFETDTARTFVYYNDGSSGQWVEVGATSVNASGSNGYIQFATGGALDSSADLFWDDANSRLGVNTTTPSTALDVSGTVTATAFSGPLTGNVTGNADTASALETARTIELIGDVTGSASFDGSANIQISTTATSEVNALDDLSDVTITSPQNGEMLIYDGSEWVNDTLPTSEPMGHEDRTASTISFDSGTLTFTIAPVGASHTVWCAGKRYVKSSAETVSIPDVAGLYYISFDATGTLQYELTYFTWHEDTPTAYVYWNGTDYLLFDERHGITLDWQTHEYLHRTRGAVLANGFGASNYTTTGDGTLNTDAQIDIANGTFFDEDLQVDITHSATPTANTWEQVLQGAAEIPIIYLSGTAWTFDTATEFPLKQGTLAKYNLNTSGTWSTPDLGNGAFGVTWIVATNILNSPVIGILGQESYNNIGQAEAVEWSGLNLEGFPVVELRPLYKVVYETKTSYTNTPKAAIKGVYDLRRYGSVAGEIPALPVADHGSLTGLADDDHPQYLLVDGTRNVTGNLVIEGNLTVQGTSVTLETQTLQVEDNIIVLNYGVTGVPSLDAGIEVERGDSANVSILWDESATSWVLTSDGSNYYTVITSNDTLDSMSGVDLTSTAPVSGDFLKYNGSNWVPDQIPQINALDDVGDVAITSATSGDYLKWDGSAWVNDPINLGTDTTGSYVESLVAGTGVTLANNSGEGATPTVAIGQAVATTDDVTFNTVTASGGIITLTSTGAPSATLADGALAVDTSNNVLYVRSGGAWVEASGGASLTVAETEPASPDEGDLWFESDTGATYVYFDSVWVEIGASSGVVIADVVATAPANPANGHIWFDTSSGRTYVYYNDGSSSQWIEVGATSPAASGADGYVQFAEGGGLASSSNFTWDDSTNALAVTGTVSASSGVITATSSGAPSASLADGALILDTVNEVLYVRSNGAWIEASGGASVTVSDTTPSGPDTGDLWYESDTGSMFVYYDSAWIEVGGSSVVAMTTSSAAPSGATNGDLWFDTDTAKTYVYYDDGTSSQWVEVGAASSGASGTDGSIQFATGGTFDSSTALVWDDANSQLEIGGDIIPTTTEAYDLGSATNRFRDLYLSGSSINLGGVEITSDGTNLALPPISNISGDFTVDTSTFHVDATNNRVGIGTSSPNSTLTAIGTVSELVPILDLSATTAAGSTGRYLRGIRLLNSGMGAGHELMISTGQSDGTRNQGQMYFRYEGNSSTSNRLSFGLFAVDDVLNILGTGNVGIGTTAPAEKLHVNGNAVYTANWAGVEGPSSYTSTYKNSWTTAYSSGSFLSASSSGITVNRSGRYYVWAGQRASSTTSVFIGIASNGDRAALENSTLGIWGHDHSESPNQWTVSHYIGYLASGTLITAGPAASSAGLVYGSSGYAGVLTAHYLGD